MAPRSPHVFDPLNASKLTPALDGFIWTEKPEPHGERKLAIRKAHPEVVSLFGHTVWTKYVVALLLGIQLGAAYAVAVNPDMMWTWQFWLLAYVVGATTTQALFLAIHEIAHNLAFRSFRANRYFAMVANLAIPLPYSMTFRGYHLEHHRDQGLDGVDTDLPTALEGVLLSSRPGKLFFAIFQILFYALRPGIVRAQSWGWYHFVQLLTSATFNTLVYKQFGMAPIWYLLASTFLAGSLHPCAAHFIAEHYVFQGKTAETYSYYGVLNALTFNVGYHNEHHDFPNVPWTRLPALRAMAPEFYDHLPQHKSWPLVIWKFIVDPNVTMYNRVKRRVKVKSATGHAAGVKSGTGRARASARARGKSALPSATTSNSVATPSRRSKRIAARTPAL